MQFNYLPTIRAQLALSRNDPSKAIEVLQAAAPYELGNRQRCVCIPCTCAEKPIWPHIKAAKPPPSSRKSSTIAELCSTNPSAHLRISQVGRAYAMQGDTAKARAAYQDFLTLWKDADADIPVLIAAKAEYAKLK